MDNMIIDKIISKVSYPKRLLKGLDDIKIDDLEYYLRGEKVYALGLRLTNVCNYSCIYCGTAEKRGIDTSTTIKKDEYLDLIDQAAEIGASTIVLGGNGEPTLTKGIVEILERIHYYGMTPIVFSNTYIFGDDQLCKKVHGISGEELLDAFDKSGASIIISCETINKERYNKIVGQDCYDNFINAIERIKKTNFVKEEFFNEIPLCRLAISTVVMPINYDDRFEMVKFAHSISGLITLKVPSLHGSAAQNIDKMFAVERAKEIKKELAELSDKQATLQILNLACIAWTLGISISNEGEFMKCMTDESNPYGENVNVRNTRIKDLLGKRQELLSLNNTICPVKDVYYVD